ncbi:MAG: winged helix-turn-helix domain-containing protein [Candidatus Acidiferrales bacterium]
MLKFGPYFVDLAAGEVRKNGSRIRLQEKPLRVLALLAERQGQLVTREELKKRLWPEDTFVDFETGLNTAVSKLRDALSDSADNPRYIETIPRRGYRFIAEVTLVEMVATNVHGARSSGSAEDTGRHSVAVLPFENLSRDTNLEYFSDGMTEALITALSKMGTLRVISRTSVMPYKRAGKPLPQIARELGVQFIVEGSVLQAGNRVRIAAQLIHGARDQHVWADRYEGDFGEVLSLLEKTAVAVASAVAGELGQPSAALARSPRRVAPDACKAYLMGRHEFYRYTEEGLLAAIGWYEKAIQIDPDFALAYSAMAHAYCAMVAPLATLRPRTLFGKAEVLARKALALDDSIAEARFVLGLTEIMFHWNWKAGETETRLALTAEPNNATARIVLSIYYLMLGENGHAANETHQACLLDPFSPFTQTAHHYCLYLARQYAELKERMLADSERLAGFFKYHMILGLCAIHDQQWELAIGELRKAVDASAGCSHVNAYLGYALAASGRRAEASSLFQEILRRSESRYVPALELAILAIGLGELDEAFIWLDKAYEERSTYLIFIAHDAVFDPLHSMPRFQDLIRRIGLPFAASSH